MFDARMNPLSRRRLTGIALAAAVLCAVPTITPPAAHSQPADGGTDYVGVIASMRQEIPGLMAEGGVTGVTITLVDHERTVWSQGFGYADHARARPITPRTLFHIGSISKTFTAVAVMQLVKRGQVDLDAPLARYVPQFRLLPRFHHNVITVRSVLDHHSGIPGDVYNGLFTTGSPDHTYRHWLVNTLQHVYPEHRVNTVWAYNNSGFVLMQDLVENVSGMSFKRYTRTRLFEPMAMSSSSFDDARAPARNVTGDFSSSVNSAGAVRTLSQPREYVNGWGAGSIRSNGRDMAGYLKMLLANGRGTQGRVLPRGALDRMWTEQVHSPLDIFLFDMGLGFQLGYPALNWAGPVIAHDGATTWNMSQMLVLPESDLAVFASMNTDAPVNVAAEAATRTLAAAFTAKTGRPQPPTAQLPVDPTVALSRRAADRVVGHYAAAQSLERVRLLENGRLQWTRNLGSPDQSSATLSLLADGWFAPDQEGWPQARFRTVRGRHLLILRAPQGPQVTKVVGAQRVPAHEPAWRRWHGRYRAVNADLATTETFLPQQARIRLVDGVLVLDGVAAISRQVLEPLDGHTALTYGLGAALGRNKGDTLRMSRSGGNTYLNFLGVRYRRVAR